MRIYNGGALTNVVNRRIGCKLHQVRLIILIYLCMIAHLSILFCFQVYTMKKQKRTLCPNEDKRHLLADLPDNSPNFITHAYGNRNLAAEEHLVVD